MAYNRASVLFERLRVAQLRLAAIALVLMMSVTVLDVFLRYVLNRPIRGSYDFVEFMLVIFVFNGISTAFLQRRNIVIDLIDTFAGPRIIAALIRVTDLMSLATLGLFAYAMLTPAWQAWSYGDRKLDLGLPTSVLWAAALIGIAGAILCAIGALFTPAANRTERDTADETVE
jgi:TRAP-type C4-dicarboxylate transport system permease small subunit